MLRLQRQRTQLIEAARAVPQLTSIVRRISREIAREDDDDDAMSSASAELATGAYGTPWPIYRALDAEFAFTLDGCAVAANARNPNYLTAPDGLTTDYPPGTRAYMNPPYSDPLPWCVKAHYEAGRGNLVVALLPSVSGTRWWNDHVLRASEIRWRPRCITFEGAQTKAMFASVLVIFRPNHSGFPVITAWKDETEAVAKPMLQPVGSRGARGDPDEIAP